MVVFGGDGIFNRVAYFSYLKETKPVFGLFFSIVNTIYPITTLIIAVYYLLYGRKILQLLDSLPFGASYTEKNCKISISLVILANTIISITSFPRDYILLYLNESNLSLFQLFYSCFSLYTLATCSYVHMYFFHYLQYTTLQSLSQIHSQLSTHKLPKSTETTLISKFIQIASLHRQVNRLLSLPLMSHYFISTVYSMSLIYVALFLHPMLLSLIFPIINWFHIFHLVSVNQKIVNLAKKIIETLKRIESTQGNPLRPCLFQWSNNQVDSRLIRRKEVDLYLSYFCLSFFHLARLDKAFILGTALLAVNYIVFIYQT